MKFSADNRIFVRVHYTQDTGLPKLENVKKFKAKPPKNRQKQASS